MVVFLYYPFTDFKMYNDNPFFIPNIGGWCLLSFFLYQIARDLSILLIFLRTRYWFHWFFSVFLFSILLIPDIIFIISFLLLALGLFCSFTRFLRWELRLFETFPLLYAFSAVYFLTSSVLAVSYKFCFVVFSFSFTSICFWNFLFRFSLTY